MRKIYFGNSNISGKGIFANKDIERGEIIFIAKGKMHKVDPRIGEDPMQNPNIIGIKKNVWLDPSLLYGQYINHSCNPNAGMKGKVTFVALRNIKKDQEITFDYSISEDSSWEMNCRCGEENCRGVIRGIQHLPGEAFKKYLPYIPIYFQKVYKKYNNI